MESRKAKVVDSYTAVQAIARAASKGPRKKSEPAPPPATPAEPVQTQPPIAHARRTVLPTKHEIVCYECDYVFHLTGRAQSTFCPKCRTTLDMIDYTIEDEWVQTLKTAGKITLAAKGVLKEGELFANEVILEGRVEGGTVRAVQKLEVRAGAVFPEESVTTRDLVLREGAEVTLKRKAHFRNVDVAGTLRAKVYASGLVTIRPGGCLEGEVHGEHLVVEEGGGLRAKASIEPAADAQVAGEEPLRKTA